MFYLPYSLFFDFQDGYALANPSRSSALIQGREPIYGDRSDISAFDVYNYLENVTYEYDVTNYLDYDTLCDCDCDCARIHVWYLLDNNLATKLI